MGRVHLFEVEKPQVVLEVAGRRVESEVLANYHENPNFTELVQHVTVVREGTGCVLCVTVVRNRHRACPTCDSGESRDRVHMREGQDTAWRLDDRGSRSSEFELTS